MKALVTGASGFIGSHLVEALVRRGYRVTCLVRTTSKRTWIEPLDIEYLFGDVSDVRALAGSMAGFDYVFHLAGLTKALTEAEFMRVNAEGTLNLLEAVASGKRALKRLIYLSSLAAVGPSGAAGPVDEQTSPSPVSWYGTSKLRGEQAVLDFRSRLPVTIIRPPGVYGPRDTDFLVIFRMIQNGIFPYWGRSRYSLLHVADLVQGIIDAAESENAAGEVFFLSGDMIYTNDDICREISAALGRRAVKIPLPRSLMTLIAKIGQKIDKKGIINSDRMNDFKYSDWTCDSSKAKEKLKFMAQIQLREGMQWTADWYKTHRWL